MAKITIVGDAIVITSSKTLEDIKALEKFRPRQLALYETGEGNKKEELFKVSSTKGEGSINKYGASFGSVTHDEAKLATITMTIPQGVEDAVKYAADKIGTAIIMLNKVEEQFDDAMAEIEEEKAAIRECITVA